MLNLCSIYLFFLNTSEKYLAPFLKIKCKLAYDHTDYLKPEEVHHL